MSTEISTITFYLFSSSSYMSYNKCMLMSIRFQIFCIFLDLLYFDYLFEDWSIISMLYFMLTHLNVFSHEIIVDSFIWILSNFSVMILNIDWKSQLVFLTIVNWP